MSNMSYCRFNNTSQDMDDCLENIDNIHSEAELQAAKNLLATAKQIARFDEDDFRITCEDCHREIENCTCDDE